MLFLAICAVEYTQADLGRLLLVIGHLRAKCKFGSCKGFFLLLIANTESSLTQNLEEHAHIFYKSAGVAKSARIVLEFPSIC